MAVYAKDLEYPSNQINTRFFEREYGHLQVIVDEHRIRDKDAK